MIKRAGIVGFVGLAALALSGCVSLAPKAPKQLLSLLPDTTLQAGRASTGTMADAIITMTPEADRSLDLLRVPVRVNASTIAYLQDIAWIEKPANQFRALLAETLRTHTARFVVEDGDFEITGRTQVNGRLLAMGYDAPTQSVVVRVEMQRIEKGGAIVTRRFEAVIPGVTAKAEPVAAALGKAANDVAGQVAVWVVE